MLIKVTQTSAAAVLQILSKATKLRGLEVLKNAYYISVLIILKTAEVSSMSKHL